MSRRNGQRARFQINRKRRIQKRIRVRAMLSAASNEKAAAQPDERGEKR